LAGGYQFPNPGGTDDTPIPSNRGQDSRRVSKFALQGFQQGNITQALVTECEALSHTNTGHRRQIAHEIPREINRRHAAERCVKGNDHGRFQALGFEQGKAMVECLESRRRALGS
jgi:hypothetical protein